MSVARVGQLGHQPGPEFGVLEPPGRQAGALRRELLPCDVSHPGAPQGPPEGGEEQLFLSVAAQHESHVGAMWARR